jgi:hypothetical protein
MIHVFLVIKTQINSPRTNSHVILNIGLIIAFSLNDIANANANANVNPEKNSGAGRG